LRQFHPGASLQLDMGELIFLDQRRGAHSRRRAIGAQRPDAGGSRREALSARHPTTLSARHPTTLSATLPTFFFDLACPLSYLAAERVERTLADAQWVPVSAAALAGTAAALPSDELREQAEHRARQLRLPLVWPERFPAQTPCALRAAVHAAELGAGAAFALAASRLAFCGGFDLDDPEMLAEAAAAAGVPLDDCLTAAGDPARERPLLAAAHRLRSRGVQRLPALELAPRIVQGESAVFAALGLLGDGRRERPLAPAG
jgi:2-hydroxychromene-2-carboxylate isomerase